MSLRGPRPESEAALGKRCWFIDEFLNHKSIRFREQGRKFICLESAQSIMMGHSSVHHESDRVSPLMTSLRNRDRRNLQSSPPGAGAGAGEGARAPRLGSGGSAWCSLRARSLAPAPSVKKIIWSIKSSKTDPREKIKS